MKKILLILLIAVFSCEKYSYQSDPSLKSFVQEFEQQANNRGISIKWDGLRVISKPNLKNGWDAYYSPNSHIIYVDKTTEKWSINAEEVIMHELGHAVLNRDHTYETIGSNAFLKKSVMGFLVYPIFSTVDSMNYRREYYYDELFDINVPEPNWAY